eukprot:6088516-Prymnesium_polylepis.1
MLFEKLGFDDLGTLVALQARGELQTIAVRDIGMKLSHYYRMKLVLIDGQRLKLALSAPRFSRPPNTIGVPAQHNSKQSSAPGVRSPRAPQKVDTPKVLASGGTGHLAQTITLGQMCSIGRRGGD